MADNLANFPGRLALPRSVKHWSLTTLREKLVKMGAKVTQHSKYVTFELADVAVTRKLFVVVVDCVARLTLPPPIVSGCPSSEPQSASTLGAWRNVSHPRQVRQTIVAVGLGGYNLMI
jgi:hypothetical protein